MNAQIKTFEIGKTYNCRSVCDHNCIFSFTVLGRTEKSVTFKHHDQVITKRVKFGADSEWVMPFGSYSMAPVVTASDFAVEEMA